MSTKPANIGSSAQLDARYEDETFKVLHLALKAMQCYEGPLIDKLAEELKRLSRVYEKASLQLPNIELEHGNYSLAENLMAMQVQRASSIANAVHGVSELVRRRALGDLDQRELNESWQRLLDAVAHASPQSKGVHPSSSFRVPL